jgi:recombinational DNA repair protein (RecF pathway)
MTEELRNHEKAAQAAEKLAARAFSQSYMAQLLPNVLNSLQQNGYLYDHVQNILSQKYLPLLSSDIFAGLKKENVARLMIDGKLLWIY